MLTWLTEPADTQFRWTEVFPEWNQEAPGPQGFQEEAGSCRVLALLGVFMRFCRKFWNSGEVICSLMFPLKKRRGTERELTTPLFLLRCVEVGIGIADLDLLTIGLILDMWTEKGNDSESYAVLASQDDFDAF